MMVAGEKGSSISDFGCWQFLFRKDFDKMMPYYDTTIKIWKRGFKIHRFQVELDGRINVFRKSHQNNTTTRALLLTMADSVQARVSVGRYDSLSSRNQRRRWWILLLADLY